MKDTSGPAFPGVEYSYFDGVPQVCSSHIGMTERRLIAMHVLANSVADDIDGRWAESRAVAAVRYADALLKELEK